MLRKHDVQMNRGSIWHLPESGIQIMFIVIRARRWLYKLTKLKAEEEEDHRAFMIGKHQLVCGDLYGRVVY